MSRPRLVCDHRSTSGRSRSCGLLGSTRQCPGQRSRSTVGRADRRHHQTQNAVVGATRRTRQHLVANESPARSMPATKIRDSGPPTRAGGRQRFFHSAGGRQRPSHPADGRQRPFISCREAALALQPETKHPTIPQIHRFRIALRVDQPCNPARSRPRHAIVPLRALRPQPGAPAVAHPHRRATTAVPPSRPPRLPAVVRPRSRAFWSGVPSGLACLRPSHFPAAAPGHRTLGCHTPRCRTSTPFRGRRSTAPRSSCLTHRSLQCAGSASSPRSAVPTSARRLYR